jgi:hypothetical protein
LRKYKRLFYEFKGIKHHYEFYIQKDGFVEIFANDKNIGSVNLRLMVIDGRIERRLTDFVLCNSNLTIDEEKIWEANQ